MAAYCHEDCLGGDGSGSLKNEPQRARKCAPGKNEKFLWPNDSPLYEFAPGEIHVTKGSRVRLRVHSTDEAHGIKLNVYPEGSKDKSSPGLVFDNPQENGKVERGEDQVLDFVAQQAGTYEFRCAKVFGMHHGRMKGKLIVGE